MANITRPPAVRAALGTILLLATARCAAQDIPQMVPGTYTDPNTSIDFKTWSAPLDENGNGAFTFGMVLPQDAASKNATEYIGLLRCQSRDAEHRGWCGLAHSGGMIHDLLLMVWPYENVVQTSFRWATDYFPPLLYQEPAAVATNSTNSTNATTDAAASTSPTVVQLGSWVNETGYELVYRCRNCLSWAHDGYADEGSAVSAAGSGLYLGRAQAFNAPNNTGCPDEIAIGFHDNGYGQWIVPVENVTSESYPKWAATVAQPVKNTCVKPAR